MTTKKLQDAPTIAPNPNADQTGIVSDSHNTGRIEQGLTYLDEAVTAADAANPKVEAPGKPFVYDPRIPTDLTTEGVKQFSLEEWGIPMSTGTARYWANILKADSPEVQKENAAKLGEKLQPNASTIDGAGQYYATMTAVAAGLYPQFKSQIEMGVPPSTLLDSYKEVAKQELERDVPLTDPVFRDALASNQMQSVSQFRTYVRGLPEWDQTENAARQTEQVINAVGGRQSV